MLLSMTGYGEATGQRDGVAVAVEVRAINGRYFKLSLKCPEGYGLLEGEIEGVCRERIKRGSVSVALRVDRAQQTDAVHVNAAALESYLRQIEAVQKQLNRSDSVRVDSLLMLPGVVDENYGDRPDPREDWPLVRGVLQAALKNFDEMRKREGQAMADDLAANCNVVAKELASIETRAPLVLEGYRNRIEERVKKLLGEAQVTLSSSDLFKEVSIFAERSDIAEEIVRLRSHVEQFLATITIEEAAGRKLEFISQEMFRETNTIGSKASDVEISRHVIEIKTAIEKIREMIQNVE